MSHATIANKNDCIEAGPVRSPLAPLASVIGFIGDIGRGIGAARRCKVLTDRGIAPADAVRRVFQTEPAR